MTHIHALTEIAMMSIAIGMDAFSLAIGIGLHGIDKKTGIRLALWIGFFHVWMTGIGISAGFLMGSRMGHIAKVFGAILLLGLGLHMIYSTFFSKNDSPSVGTMLSSQLAFAAGVSIDALSVGFSLGLRSTTYGLVSAASFGFTAMAMCLLGLFIGKRANNVAGKYGEMVGACILIGYGLHFLLA